MQETTRRMRKATIGADCVACGCCVKVCPKCAMIIDRGVCAKVDESLCVGCGKCAKECPAGVIEIREMCV